MSRRVQTWDPEQGWLPFGELPEVMRKVMLRREREKRGGVVKKGEAGAERELRVLSLTRMMLAGDLVSCGMAPPLLPTQEAILRLLYVVGEAGTGVLLRVVPCNEATLFQQLKRLVDAGLVERRSERRRVEGEANAGRKWRNGRRVKVYWLSAGGRRMVKAWEEAARRKLEEVMGLMRGKSVTRV